MELQNLLLTPSELIIRDSCFQVPIHPSIIQYQHKLETLNAEHFFHPAVNAWKKELRGYTKSLDLSSQEKREEKEWITQSFLKPERFIRKKFQTERYGSFENNTQQDDRGFSGYISIGRNFGSLYFNNTDEFHAFPYPKYLNLTEAKLAEYKIPGEEHQIYTHRQHNIDHFPQALLLRTWAMIYLNQVLTEVYNDKENT